ncbi:MAG: hypothetical protein KGN34_02800 [Sphingomonadales bacterium]|nr:hypothetical protein [Sphingomonadales bacterium]
MSALVLTWRRPDATVTLAPRGPLAGTTLTATAAIIGPPGPSTVAAEAARDAAVAARLGAESAASAAAASAAFAAALAATAGVTPQNLLPVNAGGQTLQVNRRYAISPSLGDLAPALPLLASTARGDVIEVQDVEFGAYSANVTIHASGSDTIVYQDQSGTTTMTINLNGVCIRFAHAGTYWRAIYYGS